MEKLNQVIEGYFKRKLHEVSGQLALMQMQEKVWEKQPMILVSPGMAKLRAGIAEFKAIEAKLVEVIGGLQ